MAIYILSLLVVGLLLISVPGESIIY